MAHFDDPLLARITPALASAPGVVAIVLGGSRARGTATETSDYDLGLYFRRHRPLDTDALLQAMMPLVDDPETTAVTPIGGWGPWIVGGGWLRIGGNKVDLLYRDIEAVDEVITDASAGRVSMHYQPGQLTTHLARWERQVRARRCRLRWRYGRGPPVGLSDLGPLTDSTAQHL
jgi:hypothetical protein